MSSAQIQVGDVLGWFKSGLELTFKNPAAFIVMALIFGVIAVVSAFIPLLGNIALLILTPVFQGGFVYAAREEHQGRPAEVGQLFTAFQQPNKFGPMAMLCIPAVAAGILGAIVAFFLIGGSIMAIFAGGGEGISALAIVGFLVAIPLLAAIGLAAAALTYFAVPRVMFDNVEPIAAMKESLGVVMKNLVAFVAGFIVIGLAFLLVAIIPFIGALAIFLIGMPMSMCAMYFAHRQVFGDSTPAQPPMAPPAPMDPPAPPAPPAA